MHWTFLILVAWIFLLHLGQGHGVLMAIQGVAFILALFGCVVLHELGHALTARRYGIATRDITLLPIGGVARLERMPREPVQELWVALAGPAVNVVIAAVLFAAIALVPDGMPLASVLTLSGNFFVQLMWVNLFLVAFNLLPAFPMDGGRVLRALLALRMNYARATEVAARVGQGMAVLFGFLGFMANPLLLLIAFFVFLGAQGEAQTVQVTTSLRGLEVHNAMVKNFRTLSTEDPLSVAVAELLANSQHDFPVLAGDQVVGLLTRNDLMRALTASGPETRVGEAMQPSCHTVTEHEELEKSYELLRQNNCPILPVVREGHLVGMLTLENIAEWVMINTALRQARPAAPGVRA